jgi:hypothetical protein
MFPENFPDWLCHSQPTPVYFEFPESESAIGPPWPFTTEPGKRDPRSSDSESVDKAVLSPDPLDDIVWIPSIFRGGDVRFHSNRLLAEFGFLWRETMEHYYSTLAEQAEPRATIELEHRSHSYYEVTRSIDRFRQSFEDIGVGFQLGGFALPVLFNVLMRPHNFEVLVPLYLRMLLLSIPIIARHGWTVE